MTDELKERLERIGWCVTWRDAHVRIQWPHMPEFSATGDSLKQAAQRLARMLRTRAEDVELTLTGVDP